MSRASSIFTPNRQRSRFENGEPQTSGRIWFATFSFLCLSVYVCVRVGLRGFFFLFSVVELTSWTLLLIRRRILYKEEKVRKLYLSVASLMVRGYAKQLVLLIKTFKTIFMSMEILKKIYFPRFFPPQN